MRDGRLNKEGWRKKRKDNNQNIPLLQNGETGCPQDGRTGLKWREAGQEARERGSHNLLTCAVHFYVHIINGNVFLNILDKVKILGLNNIKDF